MRNELQEAFFQSSDTESIAPDDVRAASGLQLQRMLESQIFRDAHVSRRLLEYIVRNSLQGQEAQLKEYTIGVEVLGRRSDFDPKIDTIVRVQVHRLRQKIKEYYATEGTCDPVLIAIPKGRYSADFQATECESEDRTGNAELETVRDQYRVDEPPINDQSMPAMSHDKGESAQLGPQSFTTLTSWKFLSLLVMGAFICVCCGYSFSHFMQSRKDESPATKLWSTLLAGDPSPIIGYPDAIFLTDNSSNLFQFSGGPVSSRGERVDPNIARQEVWNPELAAHAGPLYYENSYTGTGELEGIAVLSGLLQKMGLHPQVKRSRDITIEDLRTHNVILLGGPAQNKAVRQFLDGDNFKYDYTQGAWGAIIVNQNPHRGEESVYKIERDPATKMVHATYGLISFQPSVDPSHRIIDLGGLDTSGTLACVEYATSQFGAETLSRSLSGYPSPHFQAVIHATIKDGDAVFSTELSAFRIAATT